MALIRVSAQEMKAKAEELRNLNANFKSTTDDLQNVEGNLTSMWSGDANTAFHNAFTRDKIQMDNFYNAINSYVMSLLDIVSRYENAEAKNAQTASKRNY